MRRPFRDQIRGNRTRLALFLVLFLGVAVAAGYLLGLVVEPILDPASSRARWAHDLFLPWQGPGPDGVHPRPFPGNVAGDVTILFVFAAVVYCWWTLRRGGGAILALTGASRLKQRQLANAAQEMAVAAGFGRPVRMWIVEDPSMNAFALHDPAARGAIVVTSGLLDRLDRDELQAVMAHETAHLANGDTRLMTLLFAVSRVLDGVLWLVFFNLRMLAWVVRKSRILERAGASVLSLAAWKNPVWRGKSHAWMVEARTKRLLRDIDELSSFSLLVMSVGSLALTAGIGLVLGWILFVLFRDVHWRYWALLVLVPLALVLLRLGVSRNREYEADATAVSLCRNPGALASALRKLKVDATEPVRLRASVAHLCIAPLAGRRSATGLLERFEASLRDDASILSADARNTVLRRVDRVAPLKRLWARLYAVTFSGALLAALFSLIRRVARAIQTHPPLEERIRKVAEMGGGAAG